MIDSVILRIPVCKNQVDATQFENSDIDSSRCWHVIKGDTINPKGIYYPHVEIRNYSGFCQGKFLVVQCSLPKLIYGNNLLEVRNSQFVQICEELQQRLVQMGIKINCKDIKDAETILVHYGKNIICNGIPVYLLLKRLESANIKKMLCSVCKTNFINGKELTFHTKTFEICFYDKYLELLANKQQQLPKMLFSRADLKDILRIEVRLNKKSKIKEVLGNNTFSYIFSESEASRIIGFYWKNVIDSLKYVPYELHSPSYILLSDTNSQRKLTSNLISLGLLTLIRENGYKATRTFFRKFYSTSKITNMFSRLKNKSIIGIPYEYDFVNAIDKILTKFQWIDSISFFKNKIPLIKDLKLIFEKFLKLSEAEKILKVKRKKLKSLISSGALAVYKFGRCYRLKSQDLFNFLIKSRA